MLHPGLSQSAASKTVIFGLYFLFAPMPRGAGYKACFTLHESNLQEPLSKSSINVNKVDFCRCRLNFLNKYSERQFLVNQQVKTTGN